MWSQKILIKEKWKPRRIDCCPDVVDVYRGVKTFGIPKIPLVSTIFIKNKKKCINSPISFWWLDKLTNVQRYVERSLENDRDLMPHVDYIK